MILKNEEKVNLVSDEVSKSSCDLENSAGQDQTAPLTKWSDFFVCNDYSEDSTSVRRVMSVVLTC